MIMFFDGEFNRIIRQMLNSFFHTDDICENFKGNGSCCYGYTITVGPDRKPDVQEYGNAINIAPMW